MNDDYEFDDEDEEEEEGEGWLASYSDLMSDLLAVFIMLYSFALLTQGVASSVSNAAKSQAGGAPAPIQIWSEASSNSSPIVITPGDSDELSLTEGSAAQAQKLIEARDSVVESMETYIEESGLANELSVLREGDNIIILRANDTLFFRPGSSYLDADARAVVMGISTVLNAYKLNIESIRIEGHTDNVPMRTSEFESNWELSADRAVKVLRELIEVTDIEPSRMSAVGYSKYHPIDDNSTAEGRVKNRRVDIVISVTSY